MCGGGERGQREREIENTARKKEGDGGRFCKSRRGKQKIQGWMLARPGQGTDSRGGHREKSPELRESLGCGGSPGSTRGSGDAARAIQGVRLGSAAGRETDS